MKVALIANPYAGGKRGQEIIPYVTRKLQALKIQYQLFITNYSKHATDIVSAMDKTSFDAIVSLGGDGTNFEILNGILRKNTGLDKLPLGIIPNGTGNSFARDLNILTTDDGIEAIVAFKTKNVDVCAFSQPDDTHYFVNLMGLGFVTDVAKTAMLYKWLGDFSYIIGVFRRTVSLRCHSIHLVTESAEIEAGNCFIEFCNSRYTGGAMLMAPEASIDDGFFDIVVVEPLSRFSLLKTLPKLFKGTHGENSAVQFLKAKKATIYTDPPKAMLPDGEFFGVTPTEINLLPGRIKYLVKQ